MITFPTSPLVGPGLGMGFRGLKPYFNPDTLETPPYYDLAHNQKFLRTLWNQGIRHLRDGGTDPGYIDAGPGWTFAKYAKDMGFHVIWGVCYVPAADGKGNIVPNTWTQHKNESMLMLTQARDNNAVDVWSLGNEQEQKLGSVTAVSFVRSSNVVTATFANPHGFLIGQNITSAGATPSDMNVTTDILGVPTATTLTFSAPGADGTATGTCTIRWTTLEYAKQMKIWATEARAVAPQFEFIYTCTNPHYANYATVGINPGIDLDYIGFNEYGSSATNLADFQGQVEAVYALFGDRYFHTEFNLFFNNETQYAQVGTMHQMDILTQKRLAILKRVGVKRYYYFHSAGMDNDSTWGDQWNIVNAQNRTPRNAYYTVFPSRKQYHIDDMTRVSTNRDLATPVSILRLQNNINRGKCVNFNAADSKITFTATSALDNTNLSQFTIAVRLFARSTGGGASGRVIAGLNDRFVDILTTSSGYNCQVWHTSTISGAQTGAGSIKFNTWQVLFFDWNDAWGHPRVYLDCIEKTTGATVKGGVRGIVNGNNIDFGNREDSTKAFDGFIDDFFIFKKILSPREKGAFMNGVIPYQALPVLGWTFEETSGTIVNIIGGGMDGTPINIAQNANSFTYSF